MNRQYRVAGLIEMVLLVSTLCEPVLADPMPIGQAIGTVADRLETAQLKSGVNAGIWPKEASFTGSIAAGMVSAFRASCEPAYRNSAELAGEYIIWSAQGNFYGDEAFALTLLSEISDDPNNNIWRSAVSNFYADVKDIAGTADYMTQFEGVEPSTAVFYLAHHVVAAYYVDATDKQIWRDNLLSLLSQVNDISSNFPVMSLGVATWALAGTGPLDQTLVNCCNPAEDGYWNDVKLADLPSLLAGHQVADGEPYAGSFYWRFDHTSGGSPSAASGHTEDAVFATLGLLAAKKSDPQLDLDQAIISAGKALLDSVSQDGRVWEHMSQTGMLLYAYAGEMLEVLDGLIIEGDLNLDGSVDFVDFAIIAGDWGATVDGGEICRNNPDIDRSGIVDFADLKVMSDNWLWNLGD